MKEHHFFLIAVMKRNAPPHVKVGKGAEVEHGGTEVKGEKSGRHWAKAAVLHQEVERRQGGKAARTDCFFCIQEKCTTVNFDAI